MDKTKELHFLCGRLAEKIKGLVSRIKEYKADRTTAQARIAELEGALRTNEDYDALVASTKDELACKVIQQHDRVVELEGDVAEAKALIVQFEKANVVALNLMRIDKEYTDAEIITLTAENARLGGMLKAVEEWRIYRVALSAESVDGLYPTSASDYDSLEDCYEDVLAPEPDADAGEVE